MTHVGIVLVEEALLLVEKVVHVLLAGQHQLVALLEDSVLDALEHFLLVPPPDSNLKEAGTE